MLLLLVRDMHNEINVFLNFLVVRTRRPVQHLQRLPWAAEATSNLPHTGQQDSQTKVNLSGNKEGEGTHPPPLLSPPEPGSVVFWGAVDHSPPLSPPNPAAVK